MLSAAILHGTSDPADQAGIRNFTPRNATRKDVDIGNATSIATLSALIRHVFPFKALMKKFELLLSAHIHALIQVIYFILPLSVYYSVEMEI